MNDASQPQFFDIRATTWDTNPGRQQMGDGILAAIDRTIPLRPDMSLLDYGAGTGLLALALAPRVRDVLAVDSSAGMLDVLKQKITPGTYPNVQTLLADFTADPPPHRPIDLIVSAMALHHVERIDVLFQAFHRLLVPGGYIAIADLDTEDGSFHGHAGGIHHLGFDRNQFLHQLARAGFVGAHIETATQNIKNDRTYPIFLATARKP